MNAPRTPDRFTQWICTQIKNLVTAFGIESTAEVLGHTSASIRKAYQVNEARSLTLRDTLFLERELVAIGMEPSLTKAHLEACGYEVRLRTGSVSAYGPAHSAMCLVPLHCDNMKEIVKAAEDGEISPAEHSRIMKGFAEMDAGKAAYLASYNACQSLMAAE